MADSYKRPPIKKGGSLVWRLTFRQFWRTAWTMIWVDFVVLLLVAACLWVGVEYTAPSLVQTSGAGRSSSQEYTVLDSFFTVHQQKTEEMGYRLPDFLSERMQVLPGIRKVSFFGDEPNNLRYIIAYTEDTGITTVITFQPGVIWFAIRRCILILLILEGISLFFSLFKIKRSVSRALRPITELTLAAQQSMVAQEQEPYQYGDLHLTGAIDTLNAIDEGRLDTRISIPDERDELRGLALAINSMLDRLDSAYTSQLRFVSDASHELRTPISVIQGYANLLDRWGKEDEKTLDEAITAIKGEAAGMKDLVEQLLFLARSDNRSIHLRPEEIDLSALVGEVVRETEMIDAAHQYVLDAESGIHYRGDAGLLKQALRILVDNAVKYTPKNGRIALALKQTETDITLSVTDSGIGISPEDLSRLFDRFFRADASRTRETGGTGLGLSIAKWIVDTHGGAIDVVSREEIGTRMSIRLPKNSVLPPVATHEETVRGDAAPS